MLGSALAGMAQTVDYTLRYNIPQARYEVYARPDFTQSQFNWGSSQVSVVTPSSLTNAAFTITSVSGGSWSDNSRVYEVEGSDFHGVGSVGDKVDLTSGVETLLFHFTLPGGVCLPGLRLYINGSDPDSSEPGMRGGDFTNTMYSANDILGENNLYFENYANTGTLCTNCNLTAPTLSK
ncbi:hypothetical protein EQG79_18895 [Spirosoma sordidisoli]|uniref:Uncharacterized protein n=1 Tax=Spirosoma sordidisoli TaxID=2502893 RepID=A0A4V1RW17_9BACT|nr:hypothetical protein EQG79_18895 [Spirosoma sordidisoli]